MDIYFLLPGEFSGMQFELFASKAGAQLENQQEVDGGINYRKLYEKSDRIIYK